MRTQAFAAPLTVWVGPARFVFAPGRDVVVGYGPRSDISLERLGIAPPPPPAPRPELVLRFTGTQWVAINRSPIGIFVNGSPASTVEIRDGQAITIGDPQRGPRLVFQLAPPPPAPPPHVPAPPQLAPAPPQPPHVAAPPGGARAADLRIPTQQATRRMQVGPSRPPFVPTTPPAAPRPAPDAEAKSRGFIQKMGDATRKLRAQRPGPDRSGEVDTTHRLPLRPGARTLGVAAYALGLTVGGREALTNISFTARPGTLTAITGPAAARSSALLGLLAGTKRPNSGTVTVDGHDVHAEPESMRTRIGIVSRGDAVHRRLTVEQALRYAAELRLPPGTQAEHRRRVVDQILEELDLTAQRATRIRKLPPELSRCVSLAVELVTRPTLLVVDEPVAGLDEKQQRHVMAVLRRQAEIGCVVVAAMSPQTSPADLNVCDQVLVLTSNGSAAFLGPPPQVESVLGTADWSEVIAQAGADPDGAHRAFSARQGALSAPPEVAAPWPTPAGLPLKRQIGLVARREARLLLGDPAYLLFLAILPFALSGLTLLIPGDSGLGRPGAGSANLHEAVEILAALNLAAVILGTALTIRTVVSERRAFRRDQAVGLSAAAHLAANLSVFCLAAAALTAIVCGIVVAVKGGPAHGPVLLHMAAVELYLSVAATAVVYAVVGLLLSTLGKSLREVVPLLVPVILASALFAGGLVSLVGTWGYDQISWFVPAQWGFAASAAVVDLHRVDALAADVEPWTHYSGWWVFDLMMLALFGLCLAGSTWYRLRPRTPAARERSAQRDLGVS